MKSFRDYKIDEMFEKAEQAFNEIDEEPADIGNLVGNPARSVLGSRVQTARANTMALLKIAITDLQGIYENPMDAMRELIQAGLVVLSNGELGVNFTPDQVRKVFGKYQGDIKAPKSEKPEELEMPSIGQEELPGEQPL